MKVDCKPKIIIKDITANLSIFFENEFTEKIIIGFIVFTMGIEAITEKAKNM